MRFRGAAGVALLALTPGCGGDERQEDTARCDEPGSVRECLGVDQCAGRQICEENQRWRPCDCSFGPVNLEAPPQDGALTVVLDGVEEQKGLNGSHPLSTYLPCTVAQLSVTALAYESSFVDYRLVLTAPRDLTGFVDETSSLKFELCRRNDDFTVCDYAGDGQGEYAAIVWVNDVGGTGRFAAEGHISKVQSPFASAPTATDIRFAIDGVYPDQCTD